MQKEGKQKVLTRATKKKQLRSVHKRSSVDEHVHCGSMANHGRRYMSHSLDELSKFSFNYYGIMIIDSHDDPTHEKQYDAS